ncbi:UvrD-helicase domain-containing protein [Phycisphaerales bacterium AB-hyl4]|uniref:DNA 3'-5' helicase n=1 Tax=Natronomicrosphaera hydrolytica TaxID=3242702 RepID=A0ABV4U2V9_9BACT
MTDTLHNSAEHRPALNVMLDPHRLIRASAGAGKTYQLTLRYLRLLAAGAEPESILATTFTRKAAGEILARVLGRLAEAADDDKARDALARDLGVELTQADCRSLLATLVRRLNRLAISTIDSFFNRIASTFRFELNLPLEPQLMDESHPVARQLRLEAIEAMLADHDDLHALLDLLRRLHHDTTARPVMQAIDGIVTNLYDLYRQAPHRETWAKLIVPPGLLERTDLIAAIEDLANAAEHLPDDKRFATAHGKSRDAALAQQWDVFLNTGLSKVVAAGKADYYKKPLPPPLAGAYLPLVEHAKANQVKQLRDQTLATFDLLHHFDVHYVRLRARQQVVLFSDLTHKLARELPLLGDELLMEIYFRLDARVSHLLLDEFQDTSLDQWRVLAPFAHEIRDNGPDPNLSGRSFFCVGDVKQAIYGWRGGCAELFDLVDADFPGASMPLSVSWRSSPIVLDTVNHVFNNLADCAAIKDDLPAVERWTLGYDEHRPADHHHNLPGYVQLITSTPALSTADVDEDIAPDDEDTLGPPAEAPHETFIAEQVKAIHDAAPGRSVAVLVSTNKAVHRLIYALRKLALPVSGEGGNPLTDCPAVNAVLSTLTLADHPGHSASAFHVVNSPMGSVVGLKSIGAAACEETAMLIRRSLLNDGYAATLARWVRQLAPSCNERSLTRLMQLVDMAEQYEPLATLRPTQFVAYVEATNVEEPTPAPIRVMTINKSKGLEFDAVVLAELERSLSSRWEVLVDRPTPTDEIEAVYRNPNQALRDQVPQLVGPYEQQRAQQRREDLCKLYVAMTRARHALHMVVRPLEPKKDGSPRSIGLSFAAMLRDTLAEADDDYNGGQVLYERGDAKWAQRLGDVETTPRADPADEQPASGSSTDLEGDGLRALAKASAASRRGWVTVSPSSLEHGGRVRGSDLLNLDAGQARLRGTLMHAWFERVGYVDEEPMPDETTLRATAQQVTPDVSEAWLSEQVEAFRAMLARPSVRELLSRQGATDPPWREKRFAMVEDGRLMRGQFDRVVVWRDADGRATKALLVDFKTDRVAGEALTERVEVYRPQVEAYRRAIAKLLRLNVADVSARLAFVESGEVVLCGQS